MTSPDARLVAFYLAVKQPTCPWCGEPPTIIVSAGQAFCGNDGCDAFAWNPMRSARESLDGPVDFIDLP